MLETIYIWATVFTMILLICISEANDLRHQYGKSPVIIAIITSSLLWPLFYIYVIILYTHIDWK